MLISRRVRLNSLPETTSPYSHLQQSIVSNKFNKEKNVYGWMYINLRGSEIGVVVVVGQLMRAD